MKFLAIFLLFVSGLSFAQEQSNIPTDSISLNKFDLNWNEPVNHFEKIDLNVRIKHWDAETPQERLEKQKRNEGLTYSQILGRDIVEGVIGGIFNGIFNKN